MRSLGDFEAGKAIEKTGLAARVASVIESAGHIPVL
jgi:hypothetical protein